MPDTDPYMETEPTRLLLAQVDVRLQRVRTALERAAPALAAGAERLLATCLQGLRIYLCAQPDMQALAERAAHLLLHGMTQPRPGLPVILLHPLAGEGRGCRQQLASLAAPGDALLLFCGGDGSGEVCAPLIEEARRHDMQLILLGGGPLQGAGHGLGEEDILIALNAPCTASRQEACLGAVHALCEALEQRLLGPS